RITARRVFRLDRPVGRHDHQTAHAHAASSPNPGPYCARRRRARRLDRHVPTHARHGRRPGHRPRRARPVPRDLGDDDGGHDAAIRDADGRRVQPRQRRAGAARDCARAANVGVRRRLPRRVDCLRGRGLCARPGREGGGAALLRLELRRPVCGRGRAPTRGTLRAGAAQGRLPPALPHALAFRRPRLAQRAGGSTGAGRRTGPLLRRLLLWADAGAVCARRHEPALDGAGRGGDLRRKGAADGGPSRAVHRRGVRHPRDWGRHRAVVGAGSSRPLMGYRVRGTYLESCNCDAPCPCRRIDGRAGGRSTHGICDGALSWSIEAGEADGVDLAGLGVVIATRYTDDEDGSPWTVAMFVDERCDSAQRESLARVFSGALGGTVLEHFPWAWKASNPLGVEPACIEIDHTPGRGWFRAGGKVSVSVSAPYAGPETVTCVIPGHERNGREIVAEELTVEAEPLGFEYRGVCGYESTFEYSG